MQCFVNVCKGVQQVYFFIYVDSGDYRQVMDVL